jgi:NTE family protein
VIDFDTRATGRMKDMRNKGNRPVVGLALSGGGARGLAHIGVLKVLEREGIPIDCLAGSSMGGIIAAAYAAGVTVAELEKEALRMAKLRELVKLVDPLPPRRGLLAGKRLRAYLTRFVDPSLTFRDLHLPLALTAVDLLSGQEIHLNEGPVIDALLATCAFPGVLPPVASNGHWLVDGGLLNNLPVDVVRSIGAEVVIASNVTPESVRENPLEAPETLRLLPDFLWDSYRAITLLGRALTRIRIVDTKPEVLIQPQLPPDIGIFSSFPRATEIIAVGEREADRCLPRMSEALRPAVVSITIDGR